MSTFMAKAENIERKWYIVDAADKPLGRTATTVAALLRGKHKAEFTLQRLRLPFCQKQKMLK